MTTERPTPETDAVWDDKSQNILEHARRLERERDEAIAARKASAAEFLNQICQANARVSRAFRERNKALGDLENHKAESIHTCHDNCKRPMCVLRRERDEARAIAKHWQKQYGHCRPEHEWQPFPLEKGASNE